MSMCCEGWLLRYFDLLMFPRWHFEKLIAWKCEICWGPGSITRVSYTAKLLDLEEAGAADIMRSLR